MIITCSSCSARYQLADAKVKPKGTKVRCPRCSHKFTVFPEKKEENPAASTELFVRKQGVINDDRTAPPEAVKASSEADFETTPVRKPEVEEDDPFDQPTRAYNPEELLARTKDESATEDSNSSADQSEMNAAERAIDEAGKEDFSAPEQAPKMQDPAAEMAKESAATASEGEEDPGEVRPFGDQTLFEIQKEGKKSKSKILKYVAGVLAVGLVGGGLYYLISQVSFSFDSFTSFDESASAIDLERPSNWYRDEPQTYQDILATLAGYPKEERAKPLSRALLAEALVLHGLLTNQNSEVIQGLGYAGPTLAKDGVPLGVLANSAWAIWESKVEIQTQLLESWPEELKTAPEYGLLKFMTLARTKQISEAFKTAKATLEKHPDFQRANDYAYYLSLRFQTESKKHFSEKMAKQLEASFARHVNQLEKQLPKLPKFYAQIQKVRGRNKAVGSSRTKKKEPEPTRKLKTAAPDEIKPPPFKRKKAVVPNPFENAKKSGSNSKSSGPQKSRTGLPFASADLIAKNSQDKSDRNQATRLLKEGNQKAQNGDDKGALLAYREAIKKDSSLAEVYKRIGMLYMRQKESQKARTAFQLYLRLSPNTSDKQVVEGWISSLE